MKTMVAHIDNTGTGIEHFMEDTFLAGKGRKP